jgi:predicted Ser/Thr protein kinase
MEYEKRDWTIEERLYATAQNFRSWGADEDLIGADLAWKLVQKGYSTEEAEELLRSVGVTWTAERAA